MNKKRTSILKLLASVVLVMVLCLSMAMPAFAADLSGPGTLAEPAEAAITKRLVMPAGTNTPGITFTFTFEAVTVDGENYVATPANMPSIENKTVAFTSEAGDTTGGIKTINKESGNIVDNVIWPHAGVYVYNVTETAAVSPTFTDSFAEKITSYSNAKYEVTVWVDTDVSGELYVKYVEARIKTNDPSNEGESVDTKVDPTPGGDGGTSTSQMIFTNVYLKNNGGEEPEDPGEVDDFTVLAISKVVDGLGADEKKYFPFSVTVNNPTTVTDTTETYIAYVMEGTGLDSAVVTDTLNGTIAGYDDAGQPYLEFTTNVLQTVNLKHGQRLAFIDLPVGSTFDVEEAADVNYYSNYALTLNGVGPVSTTRTSADVNTALAITPSNSLVGEAANSVAYTNTRNTTTPTGIAVDDLPYFALIGAVLLGLAGFVVFSLRRKAKYNA